MYFIGIDIAKYKHQICITGTTGEVIKEFSFDNNVTGFKMFLNVLKSIDRSLEIRIGLEATGHYSNNLKQFICASGYTFYEYNPSLYYKFSKATTLREKPRMIRLMQDNYLVCSGPLTTRLFILNITTLVN